VSYFTIMPVTGAEGPVPAPDRGVADHGTGRGGGGVAGRCRGKSAGARNFRRARADVLAGWPRVSCRRRLGPEIRRRTRSWCTGAENFSDAPGACEMEGRPPPLPVDVRAGLRLPRGRRAGEDGEDLSVGRKKRLVYPRLAPRVKQRPGVPFPAAPTRNRR